MYPVAQTAVRQSSTPEGSFGAVGATSFHCDCAPRRRLPGSGEGWLGGVRDRFGGGWSDVMESCRRQRVDDDDVSLRSVQSGYSICMSSGCCAWNVSSVPRPGALMA